MEDGVVEYSNRQQHVPSDSPTGSLSICLWLNVCLWPNVLLEGAPPLLPGTMCWHAPKPSLLPLFHRHSQHLPVIISSTKMYQVLFGWSNSYKSSSPQLKAGKNVETFIVEYLRLRALFKHWLLGKFLGAKKWESLWWYSLFFSQCWCVRVECTNV